MKSNILTPDTIDTFMTLSSVETVFGIKFQESGWYIKDNHYMCKPDILYQMGEKKK